MNATRVARPKPGLGLLGGDDEPTINEMLEKDPDSVFTGMEEERRKVLIERFGGHTMSQLNKVIAAESFSPRLDKVQTSPNLVQGVTSGRPGSIKDVEEALDESQKSRDALRAALSLANNVGLPSSVLKKEPHAAPEATQEVGEGVAEPEQPKPAAAPLLAAPPAPSTPASEPVAPAPAEVADPLINMRSLYEEVKRSNAAVTGGERKLNRSVNLDPAMVDLIPILCDLWTGQAGFKISMANLMRKYIKEGLERDCEHFLGGKKE
ncbi:hypothetical protein ATN89_17275 [Comamonas thiooxydans]|uniref:hypothetical protein n=1 Tax=Comamonas thiooxydans TaxID=363952 RepID=UPI0007C5806A|nr:hypothetical protein [Comamonas thiooxydans]OAD82835.1 hypothetical protein ATN89_17275 [Comamonas thiooxydans]